MAIRAERPSDHADVQALHVAAFTVDPVTRAVRTADDVVEARLVDELREDDGFLPHLSLVAVDGDDLIGHVIATRGWLEPIGSPALGLGPLGVRPELHGRGVGTVLVHALLAVAEACEEPLVALLGSPGYYRRFGFVRSPALRGPPPHPSWGEEFQACPPTRPPPPGAVRPAGAVPPPLGKTSP